MHEKNVIHFCFLLLKVEGKMEKEKHDKLKAYEGTHPR